MISEKTEDDTTVTEQGFQTEPWGSVVSTKRTALMNSTHPGEHHCEEEFNCFFFSSAWNDSPPLSWLQANGNIITFGSARFTTDELKGRQQHYRETTHPKGDNKPKGRQQNVCLLSAPTRRNRPASERGQANLLVTLSDTSGWGPHPGCVRSNGWEDTPAGDPRDAD